MNPIRPNVKPTKLRGLPGINKITCATLSHDRAWARKLGERVEFEGRRYISIGAYDDFDSIVTLIPFTPLGLAHYVGWRLRRGQRRARCRLYHFVCKGLMRAFPRHSLRILRHLMHLGRESYYEAWTKGL